MKHLFLAVVLLTVTFTSALAGGRPTKAENDAAMKAGRTQITQKTTDLEKSVIDHNTVAAQAAVREVQHLMANGMQQMLHEINMETGDQQKASFAHYNQAEKAVNEFNQLSKNVSTNGKQLVEKAHAFIKLY